MSSDVNRYSILAPNVIPPGFVDGKVVTEKVLNALQLDPNDYRLGHTKVFFKAGVLGTLEDIRDERLSKIMSNFQARIRGYLIRKNYKKLQDQRLEQSAAIYIIRLDFSSAVVDEVVGGGANDPTKKAHH